MRFIETALIADRSIDIVQLVQTGKVFRDRSLHDPKALGNTRERLKKIIPIANERFHEALDEVELEIVSGTLDHTLWLVVVVFESYIPTG